MSEPLRYMCTSHGLMLDEDGDYVTYADHVAAVAEAEQGQRDAVARAESEIQQAFQHGLEVGQRDMLARCIAAVEALCGPHEEVPDGVLAALLALAETYDSDGG